jgi:hypothetical protein
LASLRNRLERAALARPVAQMAHNHDDSSADSRLCHAARRDERWFKSEVLLKLDAFSLRESDNATGASLADLLAHPGRARKIREGMPNRVSPDFGR